MYSTRRLTTAVAVTVGLSLAAMLGGCSAVADKAVDKALEDSNVELDGLGSEIPASFPTDVPLPMTGVTLETAVAVGELYTMRYTVTDPKVAADAYRAALVASGYSIDTEFDNLGSDANNVGFVATNGNWSVTSVGFGPDPVDGLYLTVLVEPQS